MAFEREAKKIKLDQTEFESRNERSYVCSFSLVQPVAVLSDEYTRDVETVRVFAAEITDHKLASRFIRELKETFPFKDLMHLKRIRNVKTNYGEILQILLCPESPDEDPKSKDDRVLTLEEILIGTHVSIEGLGQPFVVNVAKHQPFTRAQFIKASQLWPTNFHEDKYISRLLSGEMFNNSALSKINTYMNLALDTARHGKSNGMEPVGAVIVDPLEDRIIAVSYDLRRNGHPLQHAVMVTIDLVAQSQSGGTWSLGCKENGGTWTINENIRKGTEHRKIHTCSQLLTQMLENSSSKNSEIDNKLDTVGVQANRCATSHENENRTLSNEATIQPVSYLCTGYDLYVTREPCVMCSMALVHSRIRRVFYGSPNTVCGALSSKHKLHTQRGLNHHFEVFRGLSEEKCRNLFT